MSRLTTLIDRKIARRNSSVCSTRRRSLVVRFEHFKVQFGELVGRRMCELKRELPCEIKTVCDEVARFAADV